MGNRELLEWMHRDVTWAHWTEETVALCQKEEWRCDVEAYRVLMCCSAKWDTREWNEWVDRKTRTDLARTHVYQGIRLQGVNLQGAHLQGADLADAHLEGANLLGAHLEDATLEGTHLEGVTFFQSYLTSTNFRKAHMEGANLHYAYLENADLEFAHLEGADLEESHLEAAKLMGAHLENADLTVAHLKDAYLLLGHLEGAELWGTSLESAVLHFVYVDGKTEIMACTFDRKTDFRNVPLEMVRMEAGLRQSLKDNNRRLAWQAWWKAKPFVRWPFPLFWALSDYGRSGLRVIKWFFYLAFFFAVIYLGADLYAYLHPEKHLPPGMVVNLFQEEGPQVWSWLVPVRALYFSIVTMTTLGFGDIYAHPDSYLGHICLSVQVILGYVMLAALVTRLGILFTAEGPAQPYSDEPSVWRDLKKVGKWFAKRIRVPNKMRKGEFRVQPSGC